MIFYSHPCNDIVNTFSILPRRHSGLMLPLRYSSCQVPICQKTHARPTCMSCVQNLQDEISFPSATPQTLGTVSQECFEMFRKFFRQSSRAQHSFRSEYTFDHKIIATTTYFLKYNLFISLLLFFLFISFLN